MVIFLICLAGPIIASSGDRDRAFQWCLAKRMAQQCHPATIASSHPPKWQTLALRLTRWSCEDDCKYQCSHEMTTKALAENRRREQYYGKWAFWRFCGMQEPASVFFSLLNLYVHIQGGRKLQRQTPPRHAMKPYYLAFTLSNVNLWIWSAVFHTRDMPLTEKLDYFSAAFAMLCGLFYTIVRLFHLYNTPRTAARHRMMRPLAALFSLLFLVHVSYLTLLPRFDYGWNMKVNVAVGLAYNSLWMAYSLPYPPYTRFLGVSNTYRPRFVYVPLLLGMSMIAAVSLEIFDFPPWGRVIDAHSLWHLATVPIVLFWYRFLLHDALEASWKEADKSS